VPDALPGPLAGSILERLAAANPPRVTWPAGVKSAVCLSWDLDAETAWTSRDPRNAERPGVLSMTHYEVNVGVPLVLSFLEANDIRTTFFVPGWVAEQHPELVAEPHRRGHEIGHHGYLHESVEGLPREEEEAILTRTLAVLTGLTGEPVIGYRAPLFEVTNNTVGLLRQHGFLYASNFMDSLWPYLHAGEPPLVELPVQWLVDDGPYFAYGLHPPLYRPIHNPETVLSIWKQEFAAVHALGGLFMMILHPQLSGRPSRLRMLQELVDYMRTFEGVWFAGGAEVARRVASQQGG
jgi:peptidoglycan/xylan/chitin deacetylase (PgdA/CDA1 family)